MDFPQLGQQNQQQTYYQYQEPSKPKKGMFLIIAGVVLIVVLLLVVLLGGGGGGGRSEMRQGLQSMSEAVGIMDAYDDKLQVSTSKNDIALIRIITRGNYHKLNDLYAATYKAKKLSTSPKPDSESKEALDKAVRDNTIDSEIITVLEPKIIRAEKYLKLARPSFGKPDSVSSINKSITDLNSITEILNKAR